MEFSRQEYWSRISFPSPGDLPDPGIKPSSSLIASRRFYCLSHQGTALVLKNLVKGKKVLES